MNSVSAQTEFVNGSAHKASISEVVAWVEAQAAKADMGASGARLRVTSLQQMEEQIADDEPRDAQWALDNMDRLRERWARRHMEAKADTAITYASRAKTSIAAYFEWSAAPDKYDPRKVLLKKGDGSKPKANAKKAPASVVVSAPQAAAPQPLATAPKLSGEVRNFPLGADRGTIHFQLPNDGVTFADVKKFAVHLLTLAKDFDISDADQAQVFAIVVRGNSK